MKPEQTNSPHSSPVRSWVPLLCVLLLVTVAGAQALHFHADDLAANGKPCPICQVAHSSVQVVPVAQLQVALQTAGYLFSPASLDRRSPLDSSPLFSRPPPPSV